jgi:ABC-type antimicrobial peptide transport system permease subunit
MLWGDDTLRVVGVAVDAHVSTLGAADPYYFYLPGGNSVLLFKSRTDLDATAAAIRAAGRDIDPGVVVRVFPLAANVAQQRAISRVVASLGGGLGLLALVLAAVGIYGVVSYAVTRRFREIGIRMALGASRRHLLHMILRHTFRPVVAGAAIGVAAAGATSRVLSGVLFGVSPTDPIGLGGAALFVLGIALVSAALAAMPAIGAAPTATLRSE